MTEPELVVIPAGTFVLGVPDPGGDANVQHRWHGPRTVKTQAFLLARRPVTVAEFVPWLLETKGSLLQPFAHLAAMRPGQPATGISWFDAAAYAEWMRARTGRPYRLPAADEWEVAARGGLAGAMYPWGDEPPEGRCDCSAQDRSAAAPRDAGSFAPNGYGLFDMAGGVWNWCAELWREAAPGDPPLNTPTGGDPAHNRVLRGGSYMTGTAGYLRCACLHEDPPDLRHPSCGMRLACDLGK